MQRNSDIPADKIARTMASLETNNMCAHYAATSEDALAIAASFLFEGCRVAVGGSVTLRETGILKMIENGAYLYTNRYQKGTFEFDESLSEEEKRKSLTDAYFADVYFASANALTQNGEIVNVDGQGNRVSAIAFGPKKVIL
ncbi:MAG: lactate utilization protein, partial [Oscillospiraceae bacterium]